MRRARRSRATLFLAAIAPVLFDATAARAAEGPEVPLSVVGPVAVFAGSAEVSGSLPLTLDFDGCFSGTVEVALVDGGIEAQLVNGMVAGASCILDVIVSAPGPSIELTVPDICEATTPVVFSTSLSGSASGGVSPRLASNLRGQNVLTSTRLGGVVTTPDLGAGAGISGNTAIAASRLSRLVHLLPGDTVAFPGLGATGPSVQNPQTWFLYAELKSDAPGTFDQTLRLEAFLPPDAATVGRGPDSCRRHPPPRGWRRGRR